MAGIFLIVVTLGLLIYLAWRGVSLLILAPLLAVIAAGISGLPMLGSYTQIFAFGVGQSAGRDYRFGIRWHEYRA